MKTSLDSRSSSLIASVRAALGRPALLLAAACCAALFAESGAVAQSDPILRSTAGSLTTRLFTTSSPVQDVMPQVIQRGVNLDGSLRSAPGQPMAINGNPFGSPWHGSSEGPIDLATGTWAATAVDLSLPAPGFRFTISRSFNARQTDSGGSYRVSSSFQGKNWFSNALPEIRLYEDGGNHANDTLYLIYGAGAFAEFLRHDATSSSYRGTNGAHGVFQKTAASGGTPELWALTDQRGYVTTFLGFDGNAGAAAGCWWKSVDPSGNTTYVGDSSSASTAVSAGFDGSGRTTKVFDSADRRYSMTHSTVGSGTRLTQVKAETKTGGTWASPSGVSEVGRVDYGFYSSDSDSFGDEGSLKLVTVTTPLTDSGLTLSTKTYYRYWEGAYDAGSNPGYAHALKLVVHSEGLRQYDWLDTTFDEDFLTETHDNLKPYGEAFFQYDSAHRVNLAWSSGKCGCSGGSGAGTFEYTYEANGSYSDNSGYDTTWCTRAVVERPDGSYCTQYFDEVGQPISRVVTDIVPTSSSPAPLKWCTLVTRDATGCVDLIAQPDNVTAYTHSTGAFTASSSVGLRSGFTRTSSGAVTGFETDNRWSKGSSGTAYFNHSRTLSSTSVAVGDTYVIRPYVTADREFPTAQTSETAYNETSYSVAFHTSSLAIKTIITTLPVVATGNNGSNSADTFRKYWNLDGTLGFEKDQGGHITYHEYTKGQETKSIQDADTTKTAGGEDFNGVTIQTGFSSSGTPLHWKSTVAYDAQGRQDSSTLPSAQVRKHYYTKLADMRAVHLGYNDYEATPKWHGPVSYTVSNHAGKPSVQATVALTSNESTTALTGHVDETDADPITAMDLGTVAQMTTHVYDTVGQQESESRLYFLIPGSGSGSSGTNYDKTIYGHDGMGRRWRTKTPAGTITRAVFDSIGRTSTHWIGTCDASFSGGDAGTDNMVKTDLVVYDGGSDMANSRVTTSTQYVQDNTTDQRVTTMEYDVRGNLLLQTGPQAPYAFHKYDNLQRQLATGLYASTANIALATDNPVGESDNRIALTQTFYDELGRVWKAQRHNIDPADGSDDDNLESLSWFDAEGQLVKQDGEQLSKYLYDRLGRQTHLFTLAVDNDSTYADVDDVSGDKALEEQQTTYDAVTGYAIMSARIERHHDDRGGSPTIGALDTNADTDSLKYTATNVKGRIQISAMWHDRFGREADRVEYGTYGGSDFDRDGLSVPARSDTALRSTSSYNTDGTLNEVTDPKALVARFEYDAAGRRTKEIKNYGDGTPSGTDSDQTVVYGYTNGLMATLTADVAGTDQVTTYTYGVTKGASAGDSKISSNDLLWKVAYPDSVDDDDKVKVAYNAQGEEVWKKDQSGNITERDYDSGGRPTHLRATTLASGFDGAIRRITLEYGNAGLSAISQYNSATVGSGATVDQVQYTFDGWGNVIAFDQDRNSAVGMGADHYSYSQSWEKNTSGRNAMRTITISLSSTGHLDTWDLVYATGGGRFDSDTSRVTQVKSGATVLAQYDYNGLGTVVGVEYPEPDMMSKRYSSTPGDFPDLDRFNRPVKSKWTKDLSTDTNFYDIDIAWDRNSNITRTEDNVHVGFDASYSIDNLNRLTRAQEGTWSGSITSETRDQEWTLNHTGNWDNEKLDLNGDGDWGDSADEHNDTRTHNTVNELTAQDLNSDSSNDRALSYNAVGEMTYDGFRYTYTWDAFYRLREVRLQSNNALVAEYRYNGLGCLIGKHSDVEQDGDVDSSDSWFYVAYDDRWRSVGIYREADGAPKETMVSHQPGLDGQSGSAYIDLLVCRNRDANTAWNVSSDGTLEERSYYSQNHHGDVSVLIASRGTMLEWDKYLAYGVPFGLPSGDTDSDGDCDATDVSQVQALINGSAYDVRADLDLDGDVDLTDKATAQSLQITILGHGVLSFNNNVRGSGGAELTGEIGIKYHVRNRWLASDLGRWLSRDTKQNALPSSLLVQGRSQPTLWLDAMGMEDTLLGIWSVVNAVGPFDAIMGKKLTGHVMGETRRLERALEIRPLEGYYTGSDSDNINAFQHCLLACLFAKNFGNDGRRVVEEHETEDEDNIRALAAGLINRNSFQDSFNNRRGFQCAAANPDKSKPGCQTCCESMYSQGYLFWWSYGAVASAAIAAPPIGAQGPNTAGLPIDGPISTAWTPANPAMPGPLPGYVATSQPGGGSSTGAAGNPAVPGGGGIQSIGYCRTTPCDPGCLWLGWCDTPPDICGTGKKWQAGKGKLGKAVGR